jgi:asparagine synthase (glutamine-hydrolysing)
VCAVAGIYSYSHSLGEVDRAELRSMRDRMATRGPDGTGEWYSADGRLGLGHRRLSIIDLSDRAAQPMVSDDGRFVISYNGEIYNYRELRKRLTDRGAKFRTESDTEVLLQLFAERGERMLDELRGMYAFAIWDNLRRRMFIARDPFGIKPLYYANGGGTLRVASQVKALVSPAVDTGLEPAGQAGFFLWGSVPEPWTLYRGIRALPAGHWMVADERGVQEPVAFCRVSDVLAEASQAPARGDRRTALAAISDAMKLSVTAHQTADVTVGVFLSAGLDSSIIASTAAQNGKSTFTVTLGFEEFIGTAEDEVPLAEGLARKLGGWHNTLLTQRRDFEDEREKLFAAMDQPSIDGVNIWFVARAAARMKLKSALSGLGGDELLASYPSFWQVPALVRFGAPLSRVPGLSRLLNRLSKPMLPSRASPKYSGLLDYSRTLGRAYLLRRCLHAPWELPLVLDPAVAETGLRDLQTLDCLERDIKGIANSRLSVSAMEMNWYMRNQLLRDADWASMGHSMEIRVPFLDIELLRTVAPWFAAHPDISKAELAAVAAPSLPKALLRRRKTGFSIPVRQWIGHSTGGAQERGLRGWARSVHGQFVEGAA